MVINKKCNPPEVFNLVGGQWQFLLMRGVFSVGGRLSLMVIRKTVMDSRAEIPRVTFSPDSDGT